MFSISNKHEELFDYLVSNAEIFHAGGAVIARKAMQDVSQLEQHLQEVIQLEHKADETNLKVMQKLSVVFITLALVSGGFIETLEVPDIVKLLCAAAMALGTSVGGWKIIRTVGGKIFKMHPVHGFAADLNSAIVILSATLLHLPVSTTHVVSGSIMGVGSTQRVKAVHWDVARSMVVAWVMTIPCTAIMGGIAYLVLTATFGGAL